MRATFEKEFPSYLFQVIPADDVRNKEKAKARPAIEGLVDSGGKSMNPKYEADVSKMIEDINIYQST